MLDDRVLHFKDAGGRLLGEGRLAGPGGLNYAHLRRNDTEDRGNGRTNIEAYKQFLTNKDDVLGFVFQVRQHCFPDQGRLPLSQARHLSCCFTSLLENALYRGQLTLSDVLPEYVSATVKSFMGMNKLLYWIDYRHMMDGLPDSPVDPEHLLSFAREQGLFWDGAERCPVSGPMFLEVAHVFLDGQGSSGPCANTPVPDAFRSLNLLSGLCDYATLVDAVLCCTIARLHLAEDLQRRLMATPSDLEAAPCKNEILAFLSRFDARSTPDCVTDVKRLSFPYRWKTVNSVCTDTINANAIRMKHLLPDTQSPLSNKDLTHLLPETTLDKLAGRF